MCNYPEESSRPLSTMECQNAFDQLVSDTEAAKAADNSSPDAENPTDIANQYQQFVKSLTPKQVADIELEKLCEDHDKWMEEEAAKAKKASEIDALEKAADECGVDMTGMLDDMREANGLPTEDDENIPTLTKETIEKATEAFLDEDDVDEVNEASCTDFCEEDAPDEGIEGNGGKPDCECSEATKLYKMGQLGTDEWTAKTALEYMQYRQVGQNNLDKPESQDVIDEVYSQLNEQQRLLMIGMAPWLESAFKDATTRAINRKREQELEAAEEDSKLAAEKLTAKMEGKTGDWKADRQKAAQDAWNEFYEKWDRLPKDIQDTLAKVPDFMLSLNMYREEKKTKQMEAMTDYDPEKTVNDLSKAHEQGNISAADAAKVMNEPTMISNFMWNNPEFNQWNQERFDYSSDTSAKINKQFDDLQKKGVIPPTNKGQPFFPKDQYNKQWFHDPSADLGNTMIMGMKPNLWDTVKDGNGAGKGDCTVADVWEQDVARVQEVNKSFKITPEKKPLTPEESLAELMSDMPKAMVDKILTIPSEAWSFTYQSNEFTVKYSMASRNIVMTMTKNAEFSINYVNRGPGSVQYIRHFTKLDDIKSAGKNSSRLYQWFGKVLSTFFSK